MNEAEEVSLLIGDIYDASLDPSLWPAALAKASRFVGGSAVSLTSEDLVERKSNLYFASGYESDFMQRYVGTYNKINPLFPMGYFFDVERTAVIPDFLPWAEFCRTRFVVEWVAPQGIVDTLLSNIEKSPANCVVFAMNFRAQDGAVNDERRRRYGLVVPHVRRALVIGKVIDLHKVEAATLADTFDALASAMFIVDGTGRIVHANANGYSMVAEARVLRAPGGRLSVNDPTADQSLLDIFTGAGGGDAALGRRGIAVPLRARDGERYVAHVLPSHVRSAAQGGRFLPRGCRDFRSQGGA